MKPFSWSRDLSGVYDNRFPLNRRFDVVGKPMEREKQHSNENGNGFQGLVFVSEYISTVAALQSRPFVF